MVHLNLSGCSGLTDETPIYQIQRLQYLDLSACSGLESLPKRPFI